VQSEIIATVECLAVCIESGWHRPLCIRAANQYRWHNALKNEVSMALTLRRSRRARRTEDANSLTAYASRVAGRENQKIPTAVMRRRTSGHRPAGSEKKPRPKVTGEQASAPYLQGEVISRAQPLSQRCSCSHRALCPCLVGSVRDSLNAAPAGTLKRKAPACGLGLTVHSRSTKRERQTHDHSGLFRDLHQGFFLRRRGAFGSFCHKPLPAPPDKSTRLPTQIA